MAKKKLKEELEMLVTAMEAVAEMRKTGQSILNSHARIESRLDRLSMEFRKLENHMELVPGSIVMIRQSVDNLAKFQHQLTSIVDDIRGRGLHVTSRRDD